MQTETGCASDIEFVFEGPPILTAEAAAVLARIIRRYAEDHNLLDRGSQTPDQS